MVDGIDGSGKSTVGRIISEYYLDQGEKVHLVVHPSQGWWGRASRAALQGMGLPRKVLAATFYILDVLVSVSRLRRLAEGQGTVIFVRYLMGTAYLPPGLAPLGYRFFSKLLPVPRRLLLVDIDPRLALDRISEREEGREAFETLESLTEVRQRILELASEGWEVVENSGDLETIRGRVMEIIHRWDREDTVPSGS